MKRLLTADEVADRLSVDRATVYRWANAGDLPAYRIVGTIRFDPDLLEEWLSGRLVGTPPLRKQQVPARDSRVDRLHTAVSKKVVAGMMAAEE